MTYDIYRYIFIGGAILCGIMFVISVLLFIILNIPKVISDLSGATARKAIKNIREQNEASGDKGYQVSAVNKARGKLTDKISPSGNIMASQHSQMVAVGTTKIGTQKFTTAPLDTTVLGSESETDVLNTANETTVLDAQSEPTVLGIQTETAVIDVNSTAQLSGTNVQESQTINVEDGTTVLNNDVSLAAVVAENSAPQIVIEYEITYIHTNEIIQTEEVR